MIGDNADAVIDGTCWVRKGLEEGSCALHINRMMPNEARTRARGEQPR